MSDTLSSCACSCNLYCSNNVLTTITSLLDAIWADILTVVRLVSVCFGQFGLGGCVCQLVTVLQPVWRKLSTNRKVRCEEGDPFEFLLQRLVDLIAETGENLINGQLIDPANIIFNMVNIMGFQPFPWKRSGNPIPRVCFPVSYDPFKCKSGDLTPEQAKRFARCEDPTYGLEEMCFFARTRAICSSDDMLNEYTNIFAQGYKTVDEVEQEFADAFGESFRYLDPVC